MGGCGGAGSTARAGAGARGAQGHSAGNARGFPDLVFAVQEQISEGDKVASRFEWTGTHKGVFLGIPPTGKRVRVWGIVIDRLVEGRIRETRIIMDTMGMMMQMGLMPGT